MLTALGWFLIAVGIASSAMGISVTLLNLYRAARFSTKWWDYWRVNIIWMAPMLPGFILLEVGS